MSVPQPSLLLPVDSGWAAGPESGQSLWKTEQGNEVSSGFTDNSAFICLPGRKRHYHPDNKGPTLVRVIGLYRGDKHEYTHFLWAVLCSSFPSLYQQPKFKVVV